MQLSERLNTILSLVSQSKCVADVGCDHGFVSIELINRKIAENVIAMDIRQGPLMRAQEHIMHTRLSDKIQTRLSDGVAALKPGEADSLIIAGMGGNLVIHILENGKETVKDMKQCILQPQSEIQKVRKYLRENDFKIIEEKMNELIADKILNSNVVKKNMMKAVPSSNISKNENKLYDRFGEYLLETKNPVLEKYLKHQLIKNEQILKGLFEYADSQKIRISELTEDRNLIMQALDYWK